MTIGKGRGIANIGKSTGEQEVKKGAGLVTSPSVKKSVGPLGKRGLRKIGGYNYAGMSALAYSGDDQKVGGWALAEKNLRQEGFGLFPEDFKPTSFKLKKDLKYVDTDYFVLTVTSVYMLAESCREEPKLSILNPFSDEIGDSRPLPR